MARKVFISILGTGNYVNCHYKVGNQAPMPATRFIQEAIIRHTCINWTEEDRIFIFCTSLEKTGKKGSKEFNWVDNGQEKIFEEIEKEGLESRLKKLRVEIGLKAIIEEIDIKAGFTEKETWDIFDTVYGKLEKDDHIYFDVTHAFRSIPLFSVVLLNYCKFMKSTHVDSIQYGAFEALGPAFEVRKMDLEKRIADIIDLTNIVKLQEYNQFASNLVEFGKVRNLGNAVSKTKKLSNLSNCVKQLEEYIETINLAGIKKGDFIKQFKNNYKNTKRLPSPVKNIFERLDEEIKDFCVEDNYCNIEAAIKWTIKHGMVMQSFPLAQEYLVQRIRDKIIALKPSDMKEIAFRGIISGVLGMKEEDFAKKNWKGKPKSYPIACFLIDSQLIKELREKYNILTSARNDLAHANGNLTYDKLIKDSKIIIECLNILNRGIDGLEVSEFSFPSYPLFLNLSNHPSSAWSDEQLEAARQYGEVKDMEFPAIGPDADENAIEALAEKYEKRIMTLAKDKRLTVHIMGEMTFTYSLVERLKRKGIDCVASTTNRQVEERDGQKVSTFQFVRFRNY